MAMVMAGSYDGLSVSQLKELLRKKNAKTSGRKAELLERIRAYDANTPNKVEEHEEKKHIVLPALDKYKDVTSQTQLPAVYNEGIDAWLYSVDQSIPVSAVQMYYCKFLIFLRSCEQNNTTFIRGSCRAEMKKRVQYYVDIVLNDEGDILACQCECPVGESPSAHCKHVCVVLLALQEFTEKHSYNTELTTTQQLKTFNRPASKYTSSPIKAQYLPLEVYERQGIKRKRSDDIFLDPRPISMMDMQGYKDFVINLAINFQDASQIPILQLREQANIKALEHDHDYLEKKMSENFLDRINVTSCSVESREKLERQTKIQYRCSLWKKERCLRLSSSNFGKICKIKRADPQRVAVSFTIHKELKVKAVQHGKKQEKPAINKYCEITKNEVKSSGMILHPEFPFLCTSPDGLIGDDKVLEVKCPYSAYNRMIDNNTVPYLEYCGPRLTLKKNHDYYYQVQGQLCISNRQKAHFVVYTGCDILICVIERDDAFIANMMKTLCTFFDTWSKREILKKFFYRE